VTDGDVLFLLASMRAGSDAVKLFPVGSMGGAGYLRALREPLPGLRAVVSGGIAAGQAGDRYRRRLTCCRRPEDRIRRLVT
jgi:2-keto-3-deoxy-6-phosphogluconate aldolase